MILNLGPGEPSYIPDALLGMAQDTVDLRMLPFLQCYAHDPFEWQVIWFFSAHRDEWCSLARLADEMGYSRREMVQKLAHVAETKLLEERVLVTGPIYRLSESPQVRQQFLNLGYEWKQMPDYAAG